MLTADGRLDLFVANGHVDDRPWANSRMAQSALFFWGCDGGRFDVAARPESSYFSRMVVGRGVAAGDLNNDGRVDLVAVHRDQPAVLLYNRGIAGHWLGFQIRGTRSGKTPIGTQVTVDTHDRIGRAVADERHRLSFVARSPPLDRPGRCHERCGRSR